MSTTNSEQVKNAAEALVAVLKEVSGEVESANSQQHQHKHQLQSMSDAVTETIQKSVDTLTQTVETSNRTLGDKLETMNQNLGAMRDANSQHQHQHQLQSMNNAVTETVQKSIDTLTQTVETSNRTLGHKLDTINHNLGVHLTAIANQLREQTKQQRMRDLETLWENGMLKDDQHFLYHTRDSSTQNCPSSSDLFFNEIRPRFIFYQGYTIQAEFSAEPYETVYHPNSYISERRAPENGNALFITKLLAYVEQLIGHKPRLVRNNDGTHTMYYY